MQRFERMENWCPACDISSNEASGEFIDNVWKCDKCLTELQKPQFVSREFANQELRKIGESLE